MDLTAGETRPIDDAVLTRIAAINAGLAHKLDRCRKKKKHATLDVYEKDFDPSESLDCEGLFSRYVRIANLTPETDTIHVFLHADFCRFGNCFNAMRDALDFCARADVQTLYYDFGEQSYHRFFDFADPHVRRADARSFTPGKNEAVVVVGGKYAVMYRLDSENDIRAEAMERLRNGFALHSDAPFPPGGMVVHFRAGDVFEGNGGAVGYGQPPLAWYRECVRAHRKRHPDVSVLVICENTNNPCVLPFIEWCGQEGIQVVMQSSSLYEDYAALMRARVIVDSRGTFLKPVYLMNRHLRMIYVCNDFLFRPGTYFTPDEWRNTAPQREMMLSFSEKDIRRGFLYDMYHNAFCRSLYDRGYCDSALRGVGMLLIRLIAACCVFSKQRRRNLRAALYFCVTGCIERGKYLREARNNP